MKDKKHILITGASGGLGTALAREYAGPGSKFTLWGRNRERLEATATICKEKGAEATIYQQDTRELEAVRQAIAGLEAREPVDLAFICAGVASGAQPGHKLEAVEDACRTIEVNALGSINMTAAFLESMLQRNSGHLVLICSVAALYPLPDSPAYSASKSALSYYAQGVRSFIKGSRVRLSAVYPGYLKTPMGRRFIGPQPFVLNPDKAASIIRKRLERGIDRITFPKPMSLGQEILHLMPKPLADLFLKPVSYTVEPDEESPLHVNHHASDCR